MSLTRPLSVLLSSTLLLVLWPAPLAVPPPGGFAPFAGRWEGTLEYQDYRGSGRVRIPVKLSVLQEDRSTAAWNFVYDDFGRTVTSFETHSLRADTYTVVTQGQQEVGQYTCPGFAALFVKGVGKAVLLGEELENGTRVEVRRTVTLTARTLTTLKETRQPGKDFAFRNQSTYTRMGR